MIDRQLSETILLLDDVVGDAVTDFMYYLRKEDEDLPRAGIEDAIIDEKITVAEIAGLFQKHLEERFKTF